MRILRVLLPCLALLLGGCVGGADDPAPETPAAAADAGPEEDDAPPAATPASSAPGANASASSPAPAPSNATGSAPNATEPAAAGPRVKEVAGEGAVGAQATLPCQTAPTPCEARHEAEPVSLALPEPSPAKAVLVVTWEATAASETLSFNATTSAGLLLAVARGASPLTLEIPVDLLGGVDAIVVQAAPEAPGVVAQQAYKLVLTVTYS